MDSCIFSIITMKYILSIMSTTAVLCSVNSAFAEPAASYFEITGTPTTAYVGDTIMATESKRFGLTHNIIL